MKLAENFKIVPVLNSANISTGEACNSINMKGFHRATFIVTLGAVAGASGVIQLFSGATDGAQTSALTPRYAWGGAAIGSASCDVLAATARAATTGITIGDTAHDNYMCVIEIDASEMDMANGEEWLTLYPNGGTSGVCHDVAILEPRYTGASSATALA